MFELLTGTGLAAAAGLGAFAPLLALGGLDRFTDVVTLPSGWEWLSSDIALIIIAVLTLVDVVADKIPAVDSINDVIQTVVRPTSGGMVFGAGSAASTVAVQNPNEFFSAQAWLPIVAGAIIALVTHLTKSTTRLASHAVSAGVAAPVLSTGEDAVSISLIAAAILAPIAVIIVLGVLIYFAVSLGRWFASRRAKERARQALADAA
ncbi:DUF4126 domain-containing protein [Gulosibacter bifidus]|uniref:DUF4126 domain-containing protein n=1 Tax=Gulosibacter bifidus TaxID=272239 RepID=A0ABW5RFN1_9MICO|nr:DUF4126 domain-containing protein [Gulosibacter bifidus]